MPLIENSREILPGEIIIQKDKLTIKKKVTNFPKNIFNHPGNKFYEEFVAISFAMMMLSILLRIRCQTCNKIDIAKNVSHSGIYIKIISLRYIEIQVRIIWSFAEQDERRWVTIGNVTWLCKKRLRRVEWKRRKGRKGKRARCIHAAACVSLWRVISDYYANKRKSTVVKREISRNARCRPTFPRMLEYYAKLRTYAFTRVYTRVASVN